MKAAVLVFPGINRERDMARTLKLISGAEPAMVWHRDAELPAGTDLVVIPGGFSYGDHLRRGDRALLAGDGGGARHADPGTLGICNGFQILCESHLLPGALMRNDSLQFRCVPTHLRIENAGTIFTRAGHAGQVLMVPISHGEGNYYADADTVATLEAERRVVFRYVTPDGEQTPDQSQRLDQQHRGHHQRARQRAGG